MKTYKSFLSFTLSLALIFIVAYASSYFLDEGKEHISKLYSWSCGLPSQNVFMILWGIVYGCMAIQMTVTISNRCLRRGIKIWLLLLSSNLLFTFCYFYLALHYLGASLILVSLILIFILTAFYVRNTRHLWLFSIPILSVYGYSLFLSVVVVLGFN